MEREKIKFNYEGYGDRAPRIQPEKQSESKVEWNLKAGELQKELTQALLPLAQRYETIPMSDQAIPECDAKPLDGDPTVLCSIYKRPYPPRKIELALELKRRGEDHNYFAAFYFKHKNDYPWTWQLAHREVLPSYRNKHIFSEILPTLENFVREFGNHKQEQQTISVNLGQPKLIALFRNKGYEPLEKDRQKADAMMTGSNPHYFCEYARFTRPSTGEVTHLTDIDPYCYDDRVVSRDADDLHGRDVRITLEKRFDPQLPDIEQTTKATRKNGSNLMS